MSYSVRIAQVGEAGVPEGAPVLRNADTEPDAVALALREWGQIGSQHIATVLNDLGSVVLIHVGRAPRTTP